MIFHIVRLKVDWFLKKKLNTEMMFKKLNKSEIIAFNIIIYLIVFKLLKQSNIQQYHIFTDWGHTWSPRHPLIYFFFALL